MSDSRRFELEELTAVQAAGGEAYHEFLRVPAMSAGLYRLAAGAEDPQQPHEEDELYVVLGGRAILELGEERQQVGPGSLVYVAARAAHRFVEVTDDLRVLVVFSPAET